MKKQQKRNWRPISLLQTLYRIFAKVLQLQLNPFMQYIVPEFQSAVPGRTISDGIFPVQSLHHRANNRPDQPGGALIFIDYAKAFDSVDHGFIKGVLTALRFPTPFIDMIMMSYKNMSAQLIINGHLTRTFDLPSGGRQGDPVFPLIFNLVILPLALLIEHRPFDGIPIIDGNDLIKDKIHQYVDDCLIGIGSERDFERLREYGDLFGLASGLRINWDKTVGVLLGKWRKACPISLAPKPGYAVRWAALDEIVRQLGIYLGDGAHPAHTVRLAIQAIKTASSKFGTDRLTLTGRILIANACLTSKAVLAITHTYVDKSSLKLFTSIIHNFTNGGKPSHVIPYAQKITPRSHGGPPITLIDPERFIVGLKAKVIYEIATAQTHTRSQLMHIDQLLAWGAAKGRNLLTLEHVLANQNIQISQHWKINPHILPTLAQAYTGYQTLQYAFERECDNWELIAQLNIFDGGLHNDQQGIISCQKDSPFEYIRTRTLYHLADLFTNHAHTRYLTDPIVTPGEFRSDAEMDQLFGNGRTFDWQILRDAIPQFIVNCLKEGNLKLYDGEWMATIHQDNQGKNVFHHIYKVSTANIPDAYDRIRTQKVLTEHRYDQHGHIGEIVRWGPLGGPQSWPQPQEPQQYGDPQRLMSISATNRSRGKRIMAPPPVFPVENYMPTRAQLKRIRVVLLRNGNGVNSGKYRVNGFLFNPVQHPHQMPQHHFLPPKVTSPFSTGSFKEVVKAYRLHGHSQVKGLAVWNRPNNFPWAAVFRSLYHIRVRTRTRQIFYKILTGVLFMGNVACFRLRHTLSHVPQLSYLANAHANCLHCAEGYHQGIQASYKHTFWECDAAQGLWRKVNKIFQIIGRTNPLQQWDDLPLLLVDENSPSTRSCYRTVGGMIDTEIIGVTLWAIWSGYTNAINFEHEHTNPVNLETEEARTTADIALRNYHLPGAHDLRILTLFNSRLKQDIYMLPYHQQAIANDLAFEHKQDRARQGPKVITQRLSPRLIVDYELLTSHQIELYHEFWARVPSDPNLLPIATINKGRLVIDLDSVDSFVRIPGLVLARQDAARRMGARGSQPGQPPAEAGAVREEIGVRKWGQALHWHAQRQVPEQGHQVHPWQGLNSQG